MHAAWCIIPNFRGSQKMKLRVHSYLEIYMLSDRVGVQRYTPLPGYQDAELSTSAT